MLLERGVLVKCRVITPTVTTREESEVGGASEDKLSVSDDAKVRGTNVALFARESCDLTQDC